MSNIPLKIEIPKTNPHQRLSDAKTDLKKLYDDNLPLLKLAESDADLAEINEVAKHFQSFADTLVLIGIGGSSLGAEAIAAIAHQPNKIRFLVLDNPDPVSFAAIKATLNLEKTAWLMVSKSGGTLETTSQCLLVLNWLQSEIGQKKIAHNCRIVTENKDSALTRLAKHFNIPHLFHDENLGGRWSCVSLVGLIPAATLGIDIAAFRRGTKAVLSHALNSKIEDDLILQSANFNVVNYEAGRNIHAIMPYVDSLWFTASWCRQLISESLGKNGVGMTPLAALGTVDQHSMLQLMLAGGDDKIYTLITVAQNNQGEPIPAELAAVAGMSDVAGRTLGDMLNAFQIGTIQALQSEGRLVRTIHLQEVNAETLGALLMFIMIETIYGASLMQVDAFDQPAVEISKGFAKKVLGI
jgi:glucose-6-phosphate isomerase